MKRRLRVAIVGTGYFSQFHFDAWARCLDVDLVAVASLDRSAAEKVAQQYRIPAVFDDVADMLETVTPDLLDIVTPPPTHLAFISEAAKRKINVVCQKPFCGELSEAQKATKIAREAGITVAVHENFRFQPWYAEIARLLAKQAIGKVYQAHFRLRPGDGQGPDAYLERQPYFQTMERFLIHETLVHHIDVACSMFGKPSSVLADTTRLNPAIAGEDSAILLLSHENNVRVIIDGNRLSDHKAENRRLTMGELWVEGERGVLWLNGDGEIFFRPHGSNDEQSIPYELNDKGFGADCVYLFTRHVVDHFVGGRILQNDAESYLDNLRIEEAAYQSASNHRRIEIDQPL